MDSGIEISHRLEIQLTHQVAYTTSLMYIHPPRNGQAIVYIILPLGNFDSLLYAKNDRRKADFGKDIYLTYGAFKSA